MTKHLGFKVAMKDVYEPWFHEHLHLAGVQDFEKFKFRFFDCKRGFRIYVCKGKYIEISNELMHASLLKQGSFSKLVMPLLGKILRDVVSSHQG